MRFPNLLFFLLSLQLSFSQNYSYQTIPAELLKNADAVARIDEMNIQIDAIDKMTYAVKSVITVLNNSGNRFARTRAFYDKEKKIKRLEVVAYDAFGNELERIKKKDFNDIAAVDGFSLYLDDRLLYYRYVPVQYPYTLEFTYEVQTSDTGAIPPWYFLSGYGISVEDSQFSITYPSLELKPIVLEKNLSNISVQKKEEESKIVYTAKSLPALEEESLSPPFQSISPRLASRLRKFNYKGFEAEVNTWKDMGSWIDDKLLTGRTELDQETVTMAKTLVEGVDDDLEKAKIIYKYVQDNTRYISVQIGIGGLQPIAAIEVDRVKYGDCKGLSNYTMALLKAVGVESYYAVVQAGNNKIDFEEDFADLSQGNHAIVAIPYNDEYHWIDCTSQVHPFGFIGDFTDDRKVLLVKPDGGEIVTTTAYLDEENRQKTKSSLTVMEDFSIDGEVTIETRGVQYDNRFNLASDSHDNIVKYYRNFWDNINGLEIKEYSFNNDKEDVVFTENVKVSAIDYISKNGNTLLLTLNAFNSNNYVPPRYRNRKLPFRIQRGYLDEDECVIKIPDSFQVSDLPDKILKETKFGIYEVEVNRKDANRIVYKRKLLIRQGNYNKEDYGDYRTFRRTIAKYDNQKIILLNQ
ncbi:DUF3857 domain-containing protein [Muricauda sp. JGD-17]|uniref:DUF3857 domain-containing protein n=1 Tax=Flagellimonas ochracea TaxID=2696472 RepID=A0A964WY96_9FLAO|nr:DUF3857 domain-containing protein [Allomuricauda ochracea]NAY92349.1 DUF3857 domain-containing protein [Allomuricauda ochracea]